MRTILKVESDINQAESLHKLEVSYSILLLDITLKILKMATKDSGSNSFYFLVCFLQLYLGRVCYILMKHHNRILLIVVTVRAKLLTALD